MLLPRNDAIRRINQLSSQAEPFLFFTDFLGSVAYISRLEDIDPKELSFQIGPFLSSPNAAKPTHRPSFKRYPLHKEDFKRSFEKVVEEINFGNSFLTNLTFQTPIKTNLKLEEIFIRSQAKYKLLYKDSFLVFSPETFLQIRNGIAYSYPMKGTIDAKTPNAKEVILEDPKETAEHITIVDLIRNDISQIADNVQVKRFRFVEEVITHEKRLLQVSSEITGRLRSDWRNHLGDYLFQLLPAGSISGAPKPKTVEIIKKVEAYERGFYTGICGIFDGQNLDSGVMIRFVEKEGAQLYYKSGGGITSFSDVDKEYQEIIDKIYVPIY
ncbi:MAG: aminodeoxychorismate synthase component I [Cyclobacteriaceae bacterium]|nr:aminodeoxychorismate synthase component I [Cyclobacteriaceae bacterium HetDA_MAG_MS6]